MKCKDCKFAHLYQAYPRYERCVVNKAQCRKYVPQHLSNGERWIQVDPYDWCGEFEPKLPEPPKESTKNDE